MPRAAPLAAARAGAQQQAGQQQQAPQAPPQQAQLAAAPALLALLAQGRHTPAAAAAEQAGQSEEEAAAAAARAAVPTTREAAAAAQTERMACEPRSQEQDLACRLCSYVVRILAVIGMLSREMLPQVPRLPPFRHMLGGRSLADHCAIFAGEAPGLRLASWRLGTLDHVWPIALVDVLALGEGGIWWVLSAHNMRLALR